MDIIDSCEACKFLEDGNKRIFVKYIVVDQDELYVGEWEDRFCKPTTLEQLQNRRKIETQNRGPLLLPEWTVATPSADLYTKNPKLEDFVSSALEVDMAHEIEMCEIIKHHPHCNVATYFGCVATQQGKVSGLLFEKYEPSLLETVNPKRLSKSDFMASARPEASSFSRDWLLSLRAAVDHLHSLGVVHNDITPSNIMLDSRAQPVMIDFGSMCREGESLGYCKRTMEWHDPTVSHAMMRNEYDALKELETWLFGSPADFIF